MTSNDEASEAMGKGKGRAISDDLTPGPSSSTASTGLPTQASPLPSTPEPDLPHLDSESGNDLHRQTQCPNIPSRSLPSPPSPTMSSNVQFIPHSLLPLLQCPQCSPTTLLTEPTTLNCGHTVCSEHVSLTLESPQPPPPPPSTPPFRPGPPILPTCPLPTCLPTTSSQSTIRPNIPPESSVTYFPPPAHPQGSAVPPQLAVPSRMQDVRLDVTICKVLSLVHRAQQWQPRHDDRVPLPAASDDESEDENQEHTPKMANHASLSVVRSSRSSSPPDDMPPDPPVKPPRPRQGRQSKRPFKRQRTGSQTSSLSLPSAPVSRTSTFEKELLTELTCEICFMLLYQPITTPCQHVRYSRYLLFAFGFESFHYRHSARNVYNAHLTIAFNVPCVALICQAFLTFRSTPPIGWSYPSVS
jgi:hypothetical protein